MSFSLISYGISIKTSKTFSGTNIEGEKLDETLILTLGLRHQVVPGVRIPAVRRLASGCHKAQKWKAISPNDSKMVVKNFKYLS